MSLILVWFSLNIDKKQGFFDATIKNEYFFDTIKISLTNY